MNRTEVASIWIYSGVKDFYFAFSNEDKNFGEYATFFNIQGLEKFIKGFLLFHHPEIYEGYRDQDARTRIDKGAKTKWGHDFKTMLKEVASLIGKAKVDLILSKSFDGFTGQQLLKAIEKGYMESRYPLSPNPAYQIHRIKKTRLFRDPLGSSGLHKFAYCMCQEMLLSMKGTADLSDLKGYFERLLSNEDTGRRFTNLFFKQDISKYL